jgi:heme-degrading monooxygenase HmoA
MHARLTTFSLRPGTRAEAEQIADRLSRLLCDQPGHRHTTFYFTEGGDQLGSFSVWDSRERAEAVTESVRAAAQEALGDVLEGTWTTQILEVFRDSQA